MADTDLSIIILILYAEKLNHSDRRQRPTCILMSLLMLQATGQIHIYLVIYLSIYLSLYLFYYPSMQARIAIKRNA